MPYASVLFKSQINVFQSVGITLLVFPTLVLNRQALGLAVYPSVYLQTLDVFVDKVQEFQSLSTSVCRFCN